MISNKYLSPFTFGRLSAKKREELLHQVFFTLAKEDDSIIRMALDFTLDALDIQTDYSDTTEYYARHMTWLRFLQIEENRNKHIEFIRNMNQYITLPLESIKVYPHKGDIFSCIQMGRNGGFELFFHEVYIGMPQSELKALSDLINLKQFKDAGAFLKKRFFQESGKEIYSFFSENVSTKKIYIPTKGKYFDLKDIFDEINRDYFAGTMPQPQLKWSNQVNTSLMGKYNPESDTLTINSGLDTGATPRYVIGSVMHHELLHKYLGVKHQNGRTISHSKEFRELEKQYKEYEQSQKFLKIFSKELHKFK